MVWISAISKQNLGKGLGIYLGKRHEQSEDYNWTATQKFRKTELFVYCATFVERKLKKEHAK